jgi:ABC-type Mn2+/Zn2+ transport system ATPase subunit
MKDWHLEHMQKTIVKYVFGLTEDEKGSKWKVNQHKKYGGKIGYVRRNIDFDIKHGVTREEVIAFLDKVRSDSSFSGIRKSEGSEERIKELKIEK